MEEAQNLTLEPVFLYFVKGLSFQEKVIQYYERRYKIKINRFPHNDVKFIMERDKKRKIGQADMENFLRDKFDISFIIYGYRKDESLQRRGMMAHLDHGIDWKYKKIYPLAEWREPHIRKYVKQKRLVLPDSYRMGYRDINSLKGDALMYIYNNFPEDYRKIITLYPHIEAERIRVENYG
jgi:phosphoadenosine phosphosulfate reductase